MPLDWLHLKWISIVDGLVMLKANKIVELDMIGFTVDQMVEPSLRPSLNKLDAIKPA